MVSTFPTVLVFRFYHPVLSWRRSLPGEVWVPKKLGVELLKLKKCTSKNNIKNSTPKNSQKSQNVSKYASILSLNGTHFASKIDLKLILEQKCKTSRNIIIYYVL